MGNNSSKPSFKSSMQSSLKVTVLRAKLLKDQKSNDISVLKNEVANLIQVKKVELAKIKTESLIQNENFVRCIEYLIIKLEALSVRVNLFESSDTLPKDVKTNFSTVNYCTKFMELEEFKKAVELMKKKVNEEVYEEIFTSESLVQKRVKKWLSLNAEKSERILERMLEIVKELDLNIEKNTLETEFYKVEEDSVSSDSSSKSSKSSKGNSGQNGKNSGDRKAKGNKNGLKQKEREQNEKLDDKKNDKEETNKDADNNSNIDFNKLEDRLKNLK